MTTPYVSGLLTGLFVGAGIGIVIVLIIVSRRFPARPNTDTDPQPWNYV